jgi:hemoglobin-like flavoprotein
MVIDKENKHHKQESKMDSAQIITLQQSFTLVESIADKVAALFYARLFELDPSLRQLFRSDLKSQGRKLMSSIKMVVIEIDNPDRISTAVHSLGKRHNGYGVQSAHYATFGEALLWALEQSLGEAYSPEVASAWISAYSLLSSLMQEAGAEATQESAEPCLPGYA